MKWGLNERCLFFRSLRLFFDAVGEENAVEMVAFMLEAAGQQTIAVQGDYVTVHECHPYFGVTGAADGFIDFRDTEASFGEKRLRPVGLNGRIDEVERHDVLQRFRFTVNLDESGAFFFGGDVDGDEPDGMTDLRSRQADASLGECSLHIG